MKRRILVLLCALLLVGSLFTACSADSGEYYSYAGDAALDEEVWVEETYASENSTDQPTLQDSRKLIKTTSLTIQTADFQNYIAALEAAVNQFQGYVENSDLRGTGTHRASYTVRIPAKDVDAFLASLSDKGVTASKSTSVEDVTLSYTDTESHLKALRTEEASLLRLLEQAETVADIMDVESRLSDVRYEIESYESQLRLYDNLIDYATINFTIQEVLREEEIIEEKAGTWEQIGHNLKNNIYAVGEFFRILFIGLVSILPFLLIVALVVFIVLYFALFLPRRKRKKAMSARKDENNPEKE